MIEINILATSSIADSVNLTVDERLRSVAGPVTEILALAEDLRSKFIGPVSTAIILWESIIVPKLLYNSESWLGISKSTIKKLEAVQTTFYKRLFK